MEPRILFEDASLLVVDKPAGLIAHSDGRTLEPSLAEWIIGLYPHLAAVGEPWVSPQGAVIPIAGMAHRLDRTTSGIIVVAKDMDTWRYLKQEFKARRVTKEYRALVYGHMPAESGIITAEIMRSTATPKHWFARPCDATDPRAAITEWQLLQTLNAADASYLALFPKTGRTHQIRVHVSSIGHPIVSDHLYAHDRSQILGFTRPALHAYRISFIDQQGIERSFVAPVPIDFPKNLVQ